MPTQAFQETYPNYSPVSFTSADGLTAKGFNGFNLSLGRWDALWATNTDTIDHVVDLFVRLSGVNYLAGSALVPAGTGLLGTPSKDVFALALPATFAQVLGASGVTIQAAMEVAVSVGKTVSLHLWGGQL